ncbi:MAG TPA: YihY/virulence factor BrkB family protein [Cyclobacteriaceae bacterium]|jgi:membrane protein|nr:YihY/virulence factor BrkB family protein [Cyclobacteriaceae bacterium]
MTTKVFTFSKIAFERWWAKDPFKESAVIAYYAIFSLPGLLVVVFTVAGYFFAQDSVVEQISTQITSTLGSGTAQQIQDIISKGTEAKNSIWATPIAALTILVGATGVFVQFQKSLNLIWGVRADESISGIVSILKVRFFSFGLIIAIAFILIASLLISALLSALSTWVIGHFSESFLVVLQLVNSILSFSILGILFAFIFKFIPDARIEWRHVWIGSFGTAILFEAGKSALGLYFGKADPGSVYGPAGSIIVIMLWVSYSSMIVFFGAEFTHAYAEGSDGEILPDKNAIKTKDGKL